MLSAVICLGLCLLGSAVERDTAKVRDVLVICKDQPALWKMSVAMAEFFEMVEVGVWS